MKLSRGDIVRQKADHVTESGDCFFKGDELIDGRPYVYIVHSEDMAPGCVYLSDDGSIAAQIIRRATLEEFIKACPNVPIVGLDTKRCFFYVGATD